MTRAERANDETTSEARKFTVRLENLEFRQVLDIDGADNAVI